MPDHKRATAALQRSFLEEKMPNPGPMGKPDCGDGSWNIGLMNAAARYSWRKPDPMARQWILDHGHVYRTFGFMGKEPFSPRYRRWIGAAWLAIWSTAVDRDDEQVGVLAEWVLQVYFLTMTMATTVGVHPAQAKWLKGPSIALCGARGFRGGVGDAVDVRMLSMALGVDPWRWGEVSRGEIRKMMNKSWMWPADVMKKSGYRLPRKEREIAHDSLYWGFNNTNKSDLWMVIPRFKTVVPFTFVASDRNVAGTIMHRNCNGNTPPVMMALSEAEMNSARSPLTTKITTMQPHGTKRPTRGGLGEADVLDGGGGTTNFYAKSDLGREEYRLSHPYNTLGQWRTTT